MIAFDTGTVILDMLPSQIIYYVLKWTKTYLYCISFPDTKMMMEIFSYGKQWQSTPSPPYHTLPTLSVNLRHKCSVEIQTMFRIGIQASGWIPKTFLLVTIKIIKLLALKTSPEVCSPIHSHKYEDKGQTTFRLNNVSFNSKWRMVVGRVTCPCTEMYLIIGSTFADVISRYC